MRSAHFPRQHRSGTSVRPVDRGPLCAHLRTGKPATIRQTTLRPPYLAGSNWQPSRFDQVQINGGTVTVDAVGQHAGVLKSRLTPVIMPRLSITAAGSKWRTMWSSAVPASTGGIESHRWHLAD